MAVSEVGRSDFETVAVENKTSWVKILYIITKAKARHFGRYPQGFIKYVMNGPYNKITMFTAGDSDNFSRYVIYVAFAGYCTSITYVGSVKRLY